MRLTRVLSVLFVSAAVSLVANAQTFNKVTVHLPYTVVVGSTQLVPGDYEIIPVPSSGNRFKIYSDSSNSYEAVLSAIPTSKVDPARSTELVLHENGGGEYTLDRMWIQGSAGGYEFLTPESSSRAAERSSSSK
jgi:hypothetical protein